MKTTLKSKVQGTRHSDIGLVLFRPFYYEAQTRILRETTLQNVYNYSFGNE